MDNTKHDDAFYNCTCPICGKRFHLKPYSLKRAKNHYCSRQCHKIAKQEYMKGEKNHQYGLKGHKNASCGDDRKENKNGYILTRAYGHPFADKYGFVLEHRLVAERYLLTEENSVEVDGKRFLKPEYVVHHKNFDPSDNRVENLIVMTLSEHQRLHTNLNPPKTDPNTGRFVKNTNPLNAKKLTKTAIIPTRATNGSAGYDLYVDSAETIEIPPHETVMLQTNIALSIPDGLFGAIYARSGISTKRGLRPSTCVSVIDSDYRGGVGLPMHNDSNETQYIEPYERVAQLILQKPIICDVVLVDKLDETERGSNGFGSTGR